jgi:3-phosphoshikimate 1-carboxyvinyltransferase
MEEIRVKPVERLEGEIKVPGDKSISHRAVFLGSLAQGVTEVRGLSLSEDCLATVEAFRSLGIEIEGAGRENLIIQGKGLSGLKEPEDVIDVGNSGTTARLLLGVLSGQGFYSVITGDESLRKRPMARVTEPLRKMGARISGRKGVNFLPLTVKGGNLKPLDYTSPIASAQVKSAILLAGLYAKGETKVTEPAKSRNHTEKMLKYLGARIKSERLAAILEGPGELQGKRIFVPGDISSASFFMVAASILKGSRILIKNVGINPTRTGIIEVLKKMGADLILKNGREECGEMIADIEVKGSKLKGISLRGEIIPRIIDEIPILVVAASLARGKTLIRQARELRVKETDRITAMTENLRRMGARVEELDDGMVIQGVDNLQGAEAESFGDHRTAMSLIIAGLAARGETVVYNTECIKTSFPSFMPTLKKIARN